MEEEAKEIVEQVEIEQPEEAKEVKEKVYEVKTKEFVDDYISTLKQKEVDLAKGMEELDKRVNEKLEALRPEIVEEVKKEIIKEIDEQYVGKIELYEKYLVEVEPAKEEEQVEEKEESIGEEQTQVVERSEVPVENENIEGVGNVEVNVEQHLETPEV